MESAGPTNPAATSGDLNVTPTELRRALGLFLTGVTIVTTQSGAPDRPMVLRSIHSIRCHWIRSSFGRSTGPMTAHRCFVTLALAVNIMPAEHHPPVFDAIDRFEGVAWSGSRSLTMRWRRLNAVSGLRRPDICGRGSADNGNDGKVAAYFKGQLGSYPS